jgi:para-nitrobenzyl esterase
VGARHGLELPFVFGTLRAGVARQTLGVSRGARQRSRSKQDAWLAFARSGDPGTARLPEWPRYATIARETLDLDLEAKVLSAPFAAESDFWRTRLG